MANPFNFVGKSAIENKRAIAKIYRDQSKAILDDLRNFFDKYSVGGKLQVNEIKKFNRYDKLLKTLSGYMDDLKKQNATAIKDGLIKSNIEAFDKFKSAANKYLKQSLDVGNLTKAEAKAVIDSGTIPINNTLNKNAVVDANRIDNSIRVTLARGEGGATWNEIRTVLKKDLERSFANSIKVLTTEENRTINTSKEIVFERLNDKKIVGQTRVSTPAGDISLSGNIRKQWIHGMLGTPKEPRAGHVAADGQIADADGNFTVNGYTVQQPGMFGVASEDINCSCGIGVVLVDENGNELEVN